MGKKVIVSVINDLVSDQRVHRTCSTLHAMGLDVLLVGRLRKNSPQLAKRAYATKRMRLLFDKGPFFYAEFNIRLFLLLLFKKHHFLHANDLDTLLPNYLVSKLLKKALVYDSHEYFTEVPELVARPKVQAVWQRIERAIFPKLKTVFTVNKSIADIYFKKYNVPVGVMRNVPIAVNSNTVTAEVKLDLPKNKKVILLQGAGINVDRGAEELVTAMQWIDAVLLLVGTGDVIEILKGEINDLGLHNKVFLTGRVPFSELMAYTKLADVGVTIDKPTNLNYKLSLPNKLFDYFQAGLPVIASNLIEVATIVKQYDAGIVLENHDPKQMASAISAFLGDEAELAVKKQNVQKAKADLTWDHEKVVLVNAYQTIVNK